MSVSKEGLIFQCDGGGPNPDSSSDDDDTSETSVEDTSEDSSEESGSNDREEDLKRRPTRSTMMELGKQRGRVTRQNTKQKDVPTKRLLRSRNKSPVAGSGSKQVQIFPCPNCKKEFSSQASVNRHNRWCKPKPSKLSPKKKGEVTPGPSKVVETVNPQQSQPTTPDKPRGRGRPRKNAPLETSKVQSKLPEIVFLPEKAQAQIQDNFVHQKSPDSSPGIPDTSSESDYEQREFAANAHLNYGNSSSLSIDVVTPDPPGEHNSCMDKTDHGPNEAPVTCDQCKMTYRTAQGFQNHIPNCMAYSSSSDDEEVDIQCDPESTTTRYDFEHPERQEHTTVTASQNVPVPLQNAPVPLQNAPVPLQNAGKGHQSGESSEESSSSSDENEAEDNDRVAEVSSTSIREVQCQRGAGEIENLAIVEENERPSQSVSINGNNAPLPSTCDDSLNTTPHVNKSETRTKVSFPGKGDTQSVSALAKLEISQSPQHIHMPQAQLPTPPPPAATEEAIKPLSQHTPLIQHVPEKSLSTPTSLPHPQSQIVHSVNTIAATLPHPADSHRLQIQEPYMLSHQQSPITPIHHPPQQHPGALATAPPSQSLLPNAHHNNPPTYTQAPIMPGTVNSLMQMQQMSTSTSYPSTTTQPSHSQAPNFQPVASYPSSQAVMRVQNSVQNVIAPLQPLPQSQPPNVYINNPLQQYHVNQMYRGMEQRIPGQQQLSHQYPQLQQPINVSNQFQANGQISTTVTPHLNNAHPYQLGMQPQPIAPQQQQQTEVVQQLQQQHFQPSSQDQLHALQYRPPPTSMPSQILLEQQSEISQHLQGNPCNGPSSIRANEMQQNFHQPSQTQQQVHYPFYTSQNQPGSGKLADSLPHQVPQLQNMVNNQNMSSMQNNNNASHFAPVPYQFQQPHGQTAPVGPQLYLQQQPQPSTQVAVNQNIGFNQNSNPSVNCNPPYQISNDSQTIMQTACNAVGQGMSSDLQQQQTLQHFSGQVIPAQQLTQQQQQQPQIHNPDPHRLSIQQQTQQNLSTMINSNPATWTKNNVPMPASAQHTQSQQQIMSQQQPPTGETLPLISQQFQTNSAPGGAQGAQQQAQFPSVIQQLAQLPDGSTIAILLTTTQPPSSAATITQNGMVTNNNSIQAFNLLPSLQGLTCQQQQPHLSPQTVQCSLSPNAGNNGLVNHTGSPVSAGRAAPCPCPSCKDKTSPLDKYKKVLPYPPDMAKQKQSVTTPLRPIMVRKQPRTIRANPINANGISGIQQQQHSVTTPLRIFPLAVKPAALQPVGLGTVVGDTASVARTSVSNPNIAVVRPMENPLQKLSDQISQIESSFMPLPPPQQQSTPIHLPQGPHLTLVTASPPPQSVGSSPTLSPQVTPSGMISISGSPIQPDVVQVKPAGGELANMQQSPQPRLMLVDHSSTSTSSTPANTVLVSSSSASPSKPPIVRAGIKRKVVAVDSGDNKSIKLTLRRKEGGDSYSINRITGSANGNGGTMKSLKIKGQIKSGEQAGTSTDVVVVPVIHTVPIPDPDAEGVESNRTIAEDDADGVSDVKLGSPIKLPQAEVEGSNEALGGLRLTHRAVIVYEVKSNDAVLFRSSDVRAVWGYIFETVQGTRLHHNLPPLSYPATNIALPRDDKEADANFNKLGLTHRAVQFLLEQLPGMKALSSDLKVTKPPTASVPSEDDPVQENESGCARTERFVGRKPFDMFGWLASKHRKPGCYDTPVESAKSLNAPLSMRFRKLKDKANESLVVMWSTIHGRGLYTRRDIEKGEMIIEYAGEVIRSMVCDIREKYYESKSIGCYMFRINDQVIDATMKGNAARFINHSCEPNCEAKTMKVCGKDHILIFALRKVARGEELTYDYKFEKEEEKIPCTCSSKHCRKYLN